MRHIEEYAVIIDGIGNVMLYNELEYCYIAFPLLHRGETPYHELYVNGIHVGIEYCMRIYIGFLCVALTYIMSSVRYVKFRYRGERLWLRVSSINDRTVAGRVWNHPVNPGLLFGQMIQVPLGDIGGGVLRVQVASDYCLSLK